MRLHSITSIVLFEHPVLLIKQQQELNITSLAFEFQCTTDQRYRFSDVSVVNKTLTFKYIGSDACPMRITDQIKFFSDSIAAYLMLVTAIVGLFVKKDHDRVAMTVASV